MSGTKTMNGKRECSWCGEVKPATLDYFYRKRRIGLQAWCKECGQKVQKFQRDKAKALREERRQKVLQSIKESYARAARDG